MKKLLIGLVAITLLSTFALARQQTDRSGSVAVLPFANISGDPVDEWIGEGIAEAVSVDMAIGVTESEESVRWLVRGAYQRAGTMIRITAALVEKATDDTVDTVKVDGELSNLFALQDELGSRLVTILGEARPRRVVEETTYDYWQHQQQMVRQGQQATMMCNGLFTSNRTLEQLFEQELRLLREPIGTASGGDYEVDYDRKAVIVGTGDGVPKMRAAFREGIGCIVLQPDQTLEGIKDLPIVSLPYPDDDPASTPWPQGDLVTSSALPSYVDGEALQEASDWAFGRESNEQITTGLLVLHRGNIVHERYAPGFDMSTRTRTWSTAKSIASTLIGMVVDEGKLSLDEPLGISFPPESANGDDPRSNITLRHVLNMSSGLATDNGWRSRFGELLGIDSGLSYWAGASSALGARTRALIREPGTNWDYENYDTLLAVYAMRQVLGEEVYREFPRTALFDKIGMQNTMVGSDRFGDFVLSSQIYTNARDLGRFGLLYLQNGVWNDERLISREWIDFVRTPAPATSDRGNMYGGQFWLVPDDRDDVPKDAYLTSGNRGNYTVIVPTHDVVIVRRGLDYGRGGFDQWSLTREVLKAFERPTEQ